MKVAVYVLLLFCVPGEICAQNPRPVHATAAAAKTSTSATLHVVSDVKVNFPGPNLFPVVCDAKGDLYARKVVDPDERLHAAVQKVRGDGKVSETFRFSDAALDGYLEGFFAADNGMDVVRAMYQDLTGYPVTAARAPEGRKWIVEDVDLLSSFRYWRDGKLTLREWIGSFREVRELTFLAADDPLPFAGAWIMDTQRALRKALQSTKVGQPDCKLYRQASR